ncbi:hypothetical protein PFICI_00110 [Pestalotiopsis fici W106-1]|uniref:Major facilitator superfamily (MFS) profile domain-containing protein n=1 Tax=Pestalotiopsis fici (strain W106-1 / CGMCC3.15140) TaxID=1229662 RepID=W3XLF3_PESFW|nr:uncharacterized protein PFICI_00110 [Pestalotiopsis fici W106-1]ETS86282.1 hypothetical protein PFICI_00110 [Pestalotiopsis fici W106-1]
MTFLSARGEALATARILLIVLPAFLLYGYNQSNLGVLAYPSFTKHFPTIDTATTTGEAKSRNARIQGTVVAIYTLGCLIGALGIARVANRFGRRPSLLAGAVVVAAGMLIQATSFSLAQLIVGRILSGVGNGAINAVVPVWQSECSAPKSRGKNVVVLGAFVATGVAAAGWVNYGLSSISSQEVAWRLPLALPIVFSLMLMASTMLFPESPRWLVMKGKTEDARQSISRLAVGNQADPEAVELELATLTSMIRIEGQQPARGYLDLFKRDGQRLWYRLCLAIGINFCAQMTGANVISYYGTTIFKESLLLPSKKAALLNAGVLTWKIAAATFAYLTVDRIGRKPLFMIAGAGMGASMAGLAGTVWAIDNQASPGAGIAATFFLFLFMAFFPLGFLAANFLYSAEIAPQDLRIHLASIGTATHWLFNFVIAEITPIAFVSIKWRYYIVYAVIGFCVVPLVYFLFPETKGKSLEEMNTLFSEGNPFGKFHHFQSKSCLRRYLKQKKVQS